MTSIFEGVMSPGERKRLIDELVAAGGWLAGCPIEFRDSVVQACRILTVPRNGVVYRVGDPPGGLYGLIRGALRIELMVHGVGEHVAHVAYPGFWIGTAAAIRHVPRQVTVDAARPCVLAHLPLSAFRDLATDAENVRCFAELAASHNMLLLDSMRDLLIPDVKARIAARMLSIAGLTGQEQAGEERKIGLTQADLAMTCNLSRKAINQHLSMLAELGLIKIGYGEIVIKNVGELGRIARNPAL